MIFAEPSKDVAVAVTPDIPIVLAFRKVVAVSASGKLVETVTPTLSNAVTKDTDQPLAYDAIVVE